MNSPFNSQWPLAPWIIDHVAAVLGVSQHEACLALQTRLLDGSIKARGLLGAHPVREIESEFWRYALPTPDGKSVSLLDGRRLDWFEVCAEDVLHLWPLARPSAEPVSIRPDKTEAKEQPTKDAGIEQERNDPPTSSAAGSPLDAAVLKIGREAGRPGNGGSVSWKEFCAAVRRECGKTPESNGFSDRTVRRSVERLLERDK